MGAVDSPLPRYKPMLASAGAIRGEAGDYAFEPKLDGSPGLRDCEVAAVS